MFAKITNIEYSLPEKMLSNEYIASIFTDWTAEKIFEKTGIKNRHIAAENETAADLAFKAAEKLLATNLALKTEIDLLIFCTQSPDYSIPTTACILQNRLGLSTTVAAFDFNLGCSGYVYGLSIVKSMLENGQFKKAVLLTGETYSKWLALNDKSCRPIFGDAGTATLIDISSDKASIGPFVYGTDGSGKERLIAFGSGARKTEYEQNEIAKLPEGYESGKLFMDGPEIFNFTIGSVPAAVRKLLQKSQLEINDIDFFVFHQANKFMLEYLRKSCKIGEDKFVYSLEETGNTVSNSIPITLCEMMKAGRLKPHQKLMLVGFGVGYSWAACIIDV